MTQKLSFNPNVPVTVALVHATGRIVEGRFGDQTYYTLSCPPESCMYLDMDVAAKINLLGPRVGQPFEICKYWTGKKGDKPQWDVRWPGNVVTMPTAEPAVPPRPARPPETTTPDEKLLDQLTASVDQVQARKNGMAEGSATTPPPAAPTTQPTPTNDTHNGQHSIPTNGNGNGNGCNGAKTKLENALKTVVGAVAAAQEYAKQIGFNAMPQFTSEDIRTMANTLIIDSQRYQNGGSR